jgi:hypothetical protein
MSSKTRFVYYFCNGFWDGNVVLLLDEFTSLCQAEEHVRDDCLQVFRGLRQNSAIQSIIAAGTWGIFERPSRLSPFNIGDLVQCPYFTLDETRELFCEFAQDLGFSIDDAIIEDVWAKSNGLVAQLDGG